MESSSFVSADDAERASRSKTPPPQQMGAVYRRMGALAGLQFLQAAAFGVMSPILSIVMTEARVGLISQECTRVEHLSTVEPTHAAMRALQDRGTLRGCRGCVCNLLLSPILGQASDVYGRKPFLVLSQIARVGVPFSVMYFMQPQGSITPYFALRLLDSGFGTAGVMNAAVADVVAPAHRAAAFGLVFAMLSVGYCISSFVAPFFSRTHILQIASGIFVARVLWAAFVLSETLPTRKRVSKARWVVESPVRSMAILFRNQLFMRLTCLIALTSFVTNGMFQIQSFYLNTVVGFNVKDFGNLMLLGGILALVAQGMLLKPLVGCFKEKGVIVIAMIGSVLGAGGFIATAYYPHKWVVYALSLTGCISDLSFPAISSLKSINCSEKEQGRLQGAIYGARAVFEATGPVLFASLYAAMTRDSIWSQALPYVVASGVYVVGIGVALSLPVGKSSPSGKIAVVPPPLLSPTYADSPSSSSMYFETDDDDEEEEDDQDGRVIYADDGTLDDSQFLAEPLLGSGSTSGYAHTEV